MSCKSCYKYPFCEKCEGPQGHCEDEKSKRLMLEMIERKNKMELDNDELEATKNMKKKSADEMFSELGYIKDIDCSYGLIRYFNNDNCFIRFIIQDKCVEANTIVDNAVYVLSITMQELKAINKKCQELRLDLRKE